MINTVLRPNHYELLGLRPEASGDEIVQAFAKELGLLRPRAFGTLAEVTVAYETLKDPVKRQAYDSSIGLTSEPGAPEPAPEVPPEWQPFLVRASAKPVERPAIPLPPPSARPVPQPRPESRIEPRMAPSATALLREPVKPTTFVSTPRKLAELYPPEADETRHLEPPTRVDRTFHEAEAEVVDDEAESSNRWKVPALAATALLAAVAVGAWTGWESGNDNASVSVKVPSANPAPDVAETAPNPAVSVTEPATEQRPVAVAHPPQVAKTRPPLQIDLPDEQPIETAQTDESPLIKIAPEPAVAESSASTTLPLSKTVIASTIRRIGYPCSDVASTSGVEGGGAFTVTCASGHSYRAAPVHGRYRFRRISSR